MKHEAIKPPSVEEATSINLVPMVDIMFLMLLFFMLGADMGQRELEAVELPVAVTVKKDDGGAPQEGRTTVNVYHATRGCPDSGNGNVCRNTSHWRVGVRGSDFDVTNEQDYNRFRALVRGEAHALQLVIDDKHPAERFFMIRGDQSAPYGIVQQVIRACAEEHVYKVESGAAAPENR